MAVLNATSFLLLKDETVLGHSTNTNFNINLDLPDASTKASGGWSEAIAGVRSGSIECEGLTNYSNSLNFNDIADMIITRQKAVFYFKDTVNPKLIVRGDGFIESVDETAEFENATTFNLKINLTGVITITDPSAGLTWENVFSKWEDLAKNWEDV